MKLKFPQSVSLENIAEAAIALAYDGEGTKAGAGWGSSSDDDAAVDEQVLARLSVGHPEILPEVVRIPNQDPLPRRLRLRYYWDEMYRPYAKSLGAGADWRTTHLRRALDIVIVDDETDSGRSVLISTRDDRQIHSFALPALRALGIQCDAGSTVAADALGEALDPDFFLWLLYRLQDDDPLIGSDVRLEIISEIFSRDRMLRGARFTEQATFERIELAALITLGKTRFGPAKIEINVDDLDAYFSVELQLDGGFNVFRNGTRYNSHDPIPPFAAGHVFSEDLWCIVLPRLRSHYNGDTHWRTDGRSKLTDLAVDAIRAILPEVPAGVS